MASEWLFIACLGVKMCKDFTFSTIKSYSFAPLSIKPLEKFPTRSIQEGDEYLFYHPDQVVMKCEQL